MSLTKGIYSHFFVILFQKATLMENLFLYQLPPTSQSHLPRQVAMIFLNHIALPANQGDWTRPFLTFSQPWESIVLSNTFSVQEWYPWWSSFLLHLWELKKTNHIRLTFLYTQPLSTLFIPTLSLYTLPCFCLFSEIPGLMSKTKISLSFWKKKNGCLTWVEI